MLYKVRNRSGGIILSTMSIEKVAHFLGTTTKAVDKAIKLKTAVQHKYIIEAYDIKKVTDTLEQTTVEMVDHGYGVDYGRYQFDKARGVIK